MADDLSAAGVKVFGPSKAAARIEASKTFSKDFMARHGIPTAAYAKYSDYGKALEYLRSLAAGPTSVVIKATGLAAGKGVLLPEDMAQAEAALRQVMVERSFGDAGLEAVIEQRLSGPEVTLLAFSDGKTVRPMIPSQDHKRLLDGDLGPNTGGMGAYAPVPVCPEEMVEELVRIALQPAVDGLRQEGCPFVGVLYGGFMFTPDGPRVIEFNCRFGDPEAQVVLSLLDTDLVEIATACVEGCLDRVDVRWKDEAAACVIVASGGYPGSYRTGIPIFGLEKEMPLTTVFHAGTKVTDGRVVTAGGRVLSVTGLGKDIPEALAAAYARVQTIQFEDMQFRRDIAWQALGGGQ
jgi:phosphoribosylamine--glycine ligase